MQVLDWWNEHVAITKKTAKPVPLLSSTEIHAWSTLKNSFFLPTTTLLEYSRARGIYFPLSFLIFIWLVYKGKKNIKIHYEAGRYGGWPSGAGDWIPSTGVCQVWVSRAQDNVIRWQCRECDPLGPVGTTWTKCDKRGKWWKESRHFSKEFVDEKNPIISQKNRWHVAHLTQYATRV